MIANDFLYCAPDTPEEAVLAWTHAESIGAAPFYYGGGSEIITMSRAGSIAPGAVIDLKHIPECRELAISNQTLTIGAAVTLSEIYESGLYPLLGTTVARIADHTNQCRITLGGNLCGTILYKEAVLPLLLAEAEIIVCSASGLQTLPINQLFDTRMNLAPGSFIMQVKVRTSETHKEYMHMKKTTGEKIDYPAITICAVQQDDLLKAAFSGICPYPFRSTRMEDIMNNHHLSIEARAREALLNLPGAPLEDAQASAGYRMFLFKHSLLEIMERKNYDLLFR